MMQGHTPGPWTFGRNTSSAAYVLASRVLVDPAGAERYGAPDAPEPVAICRGDSEIRKANARLIAAAPDLLEALRRAAPIVEAFSEEDNTGHITAALLAIQAAIDRATGQTTNP